MVFNLNAVGLGECEDLKLSPEELAELEAARPAGSSSGGIPVPKTLCMSGLYETACKMPHSCIPSCNCEAMAETPCLASPIIWIALLTLTLHHFPPRPAPPRPAPPRPAPISLFPSSSPPLPPCSTCNDCLLLHRGR